MNEKNERDLFKDLIDSIHVEEDQAPSEGEPIQVPVQRTDGARPYQKAGQESVQEPQSEATQQGEEDLPRWLTEKRRLDQSGKPSGTAGENKSEPSAPSQQKQKVQPDSAGTAPDSSSRKPQKNDGPAAGEEFQVNISQEDYERPSLPAEQQAGEKQQAQPAAGESKRGPKKKKKIKKQYRVGRAFLLTLLFLGLSVYLAFFALRAFEDLTAVTLFGDTGATEQQMTVEIPEGASVGEITSILKKSGVITEPLAFRLYIMLKQEDGFQSGEYIMTNKMDYDSIIYVLQAGDARTDTVTIMFPEGSTSVDIAQKLEENDVCSASDFLAALNKQDYNYTFVENIPQDELRFYLLEGYLFPNTHEFFVGESADSVINRFLEDFSKKITDDMRTRMNELNLTLDQTLTLASIIQKEASDPDEMKNVSEVFHNRLRNPDAYPNLQSDPTIYYVEQVIKKNIGIANQEVYDAYNTYVCNGLPVGPICNPGLDAIEAALYPAEHEETYYYFITDKAGTYYYAQTLEQHNENIRQAEQVNAQLAESASSEAE